MEQKGEILNLYKPIGFTPKETIEFFRNQHPEYKKIKMGYAGRLDPMAEGILVVLVGNKNKELSLYLNADKEYLAEVLFGFETDSGDLLGLTVKECLLKIEKQELKKTINKLLGIQNLPIPAYSAYRLKGKPFFWWAKQGRLAEVPQPQQQVIINSIALENLSFITGKEISQRIKKRISLVKGDFRQEKIKNNWHKALQDKGQQKYSLAQIRINCSTGTYIRSLTVLLGQKLNTCAVLYGLKRTRVGNYTIKETSNLT
jgi:tRNA pseudouridine55 synthase